MNRNQHKSSNVFCSSSALAPHNWDLRSWNLTRQPWRSGVLEPHAPAMTWRPDRRILCISLERHPHKSKEINTTHQRSPFKTQDPSRRDQSADRRRIAEYYVSHWKEIKRNQKKSTQIIKDHHSKARIQRLRPIGGSAADRRILCISLERHLDRRILCTSLEINQQKST